MAIHTYNQQASASEMAAEIDRRGAVIEALEAKIDALSARLTPPTEVTRYDWVYGGMDDDPEGEYVRYEDHAAALAAERAARKEADNRWRANLQNAWSALSMIREAVEEFGPIADLEGEDAVLLRGPEPVHAAEAIIDALGRVRAALALKEAERISFAKLYAGEGHKAMVLAEEKSKAEAAALAAERAARIEAEMALKAAIRAADLALFVIRKQGVMPNSSWEAGFEKDLAIARAALSPSNPGDAASPKPEEGGKVMVFDRRHPSTTPLNEWSDGWLKMEVANLLDEPLYIVAHYDEKLDNKWPTTRDEMIEYIKSRRPTPPEAQ